MAKKKKRWIKGESSWVDPAKIQRKGRPSNALLRTLRDKPSPSQWESLVAAAVSAIVNKERNLYISFSYLVKLPKDFPQTFFVEENGLNITYKVNAKRVLKWLYENGYTSITIRELQMMQRKVTLLTRDVDNMLGNSVECELQIDEEEE